MALPTVTAEDRTILLNEFIEALSLFTASDSDGDPIQKVRFREFNTAAGSGFFTFNGIVQPPNVNLTFDYIDVLNGNVLYNAGTSISSEVVEVSVRAGGEWSSVAPFTMYSVTENITRPVVTVADLLVIQNESINMAEHVSFSDPDGYPVVRWKFLDRNEGVNSGKFFLGGVEMPAQQWFYVAADDLQNLEFSAAFSAPNNDRIDVRAYDGTNINGDRSQGWSLRKTFDLATGLNANRPVVIPQETTTGPRSLIPMGDLFSFSDADNSTAKAFRFFDTSPHAFSGYMLRNGIQQPSKQWIEVTADQLGSMQWVAANKDFSELIRVQVFDGRHLSKIGTVRVNSFEKPLYVSPDTVIFNELEIDLVSDHYTKLDDGPTYTSYQIYDASGDVDPNSVSDRSAKFKLGDNVYANSQVHTLSPFDFSQLNFQGGAIDVPQYDEMYVRANNGLAWGDWERLNVQTEPHHIDGLAASSWMPFLQQTGDKFVMSFSFMEAFPNYNTGAAGADSFRRPWSNPEAGTFDSMKDAWREVFTVYEEMVNLDFQEVADSSINQLGQQGGIIRLGTYCSPAPDGTIGFAFFPTSAPEGGDVWLNRQFTGGPGGLAPSGSDPIMCAGQTIDDFTAGEDNSQGALIFLAMLHELGHVLGLKHPDVPSPITSPLAFDTNHSIMQSGAQTNPAGDNFSQTPMLYDIAALQSIYGENPTFMQGDSVYDVDYWATDYGFPHPTGGMQRSELIWDSGGTDVIDMSDTQFVNNLIDLRQAKFSNLGGFEGNIGIGLDVLIENAIGGPEADMIIGNESVNDIQGLAGDDTIQGYAGDDHLNGGMGDDTYVYMTGDHHDTIDEDTLAGRDNILVDTFLGLDNFADDMSFSRLGNDLVINFTIDQDISRGSMTVKNQLWGGSRVETLNIVNKPVDLVYLFANLTQPNQRFEITSVMDTYGFQVAPVT